MKPIAFALAAALLAAPALGQEAEITAEQASEQTAIEVRAAQVVDQRGLQTALVGALVHVTHHLDVGCAATPASCRRRAVRCQIDVHRPVQSRPGSADAADGISASGKTIGRLLGDLWAGK